MIELHQQPLAQVLLSLRTSPAGLGAAEAQRRLLEYGPNRLREARRRPLLLRLLKEFSHFFAVVLWLAAGLAFLLERATPGEGMARLGYFIVVVIVISGLFSFWQEFRVERALAALRRLLPHRVRVLRDGQGMELDTDRLVPGDVILLEQGDSVPADCLLIEAYGVRVNNASVTGESVPQLRDARPSQEQALSRGRNVLLAGTALAAGRGRAVVFATGSHTEFDRIAQLTQTRGEVVSPLRREIAHLSRLIVILGLSIGLSFFVIGWLIGFPLRQDFIFAIGIIVAMVPEGLLPTLTLALVLATQRMARRNVLIRHLPAVEALGSATVICTDKTGTLTQNRMRVRSVLAGDGSRPIPVEEALGRGRDCRTLFLIAGLCHDLTETSEGGARAWLGDPMEVALLDLSRAALGEPPAWARIDELPFDTARMRQTTVYATADGPVLYCKGAPETLLRLCTRCQSEAGEAPFSASRRSAVRRAQEAMAASGLRVLALAYRPLAAGEQAAEAERELVFAGLLGLEDPPRPEVPAAIETCRQAGIKVIMVTGDHPRTALAIAREIGLVRSPRARVISGEELRRLSDTQLQLALDEPEIQFARVSAEQKMRIVEALKRKGQIVAVTGDGVNDAPALKSAHIGIAMGLSGTDVAKETADLVLLDDNFASIVSGIEEGRAVFDNIRKFLTYILAHNVPELVPYLAFALFRIPLALTPIQMLAVDMGSDSLTALGLGVERPEPGLMRRPPRPPQQRLLDWRVAVRAYLVLGLLEALALMSIFLLLLHQGGWRYGQVLDAANPLYLYATTASLGCIVLLQVVNVFICRSPTRSLRDTGLFGNPLILLGVLVEFGSIGLIAYTPLGNAFFGTAPVSPADWLWVVPFAAALLVVEELRKAWRRRVIARRAAGRR